MPNKGISKTGTILFCVEDMVIKASATNSHRICRRLYWITSFYNKPSASTPYNAQQIFPNKI